MRINIALFLVAVMICGAVSAPVDRSPGHHLVRRGGSDEESDTSTGKEEKSSSKSDDAETEEDTSSKSEKTEKSSEDTSESSDEESTDTKSDKKADESQSEDDSESTEEETKETTSESKSKVDSESDEDKTEKDTDNDESESSSTSTGSISGSFEGMSTFYDGKGTHACGNEGEDGELTVAINTKQMGTKSNGNVNCFKMMTIVWKGKTAKAKVTDQCPPCADKQIDVSQAVADFFGDDFKSAGENQVTWSM
ncbi:hypothetical protein H4R33_006884 [Dimargaris cristalligena]|nr:hypothetical protein H4R33_006884 [Dimargaris cristalligena]